MKPKTMILLVVAIGCGLVASVMTSRLIAERNEQPAEKTVKVLFARTKIKAFELIKEPQKLFIEKDIAESIAPKKSIRSYEELKDKRVSRAIPEDALIAPEDLVSKDLDGLSASLEKGTRAVAFRVSPECLAGGFVLPGSRVDVLHVLRRGDATVAHTILQNMLVLAVDMNPHRNAEQQTLLGSTVTMSVRPEEAQRIFLASTTGELRLVLRPVGEDKQQSVKGSTVDDLTRPIAEPNDATDGSEYSSDKLVSLAGLVPPLPPLPAREPEPEPMKTPEVVKQPEPEPIKIVKPTEPRIRTLTIISGDQVQKVKEEEKR